MIKNKILIPLIIFITLGFNLTVVSASHIVGGEMTYRCMGNGTFEITLTIYRDCFFGNPQADFDDPAWIGVFQNGGLAPGVSDNGIITVAPPAPFDTLRQILTSDCFVQGDPVCVERAIHTTTVQLPYSDSGYILSYQRCCRNETIRNIIDPDQTGANIWCYVPAEATQVVDRECNSNPVFNEYPPIFLCTNDPIDFDHSATDIDGDQLVYRLCTPNVALSFDQSQVQSAEQFDRPPFDPVTFQPGFGLGDLLGGTGTSMRIDPNTGFLTGVPTDVGQYLVGVCVDEFRDGVLLSESRRDFQFNVRSCEDAPLACIDEEAAFSCESLEVSFDNCGDGSMFHWFFGDGSESQEVSPNHTYSEPGRYRVTLVALIDESCTDTTFLDIAVNNVVGEDILLLESYNSCTGDVVLTANPQSTRPVKIQWSYTPDFSEIIMFGDEFTVPTDVVNGTIVYVQVIAENGCVSMDQAVINTTVPNFSVIFETYNTCTGISEIEAIIPDGISNPVITWSLSPTCDPALATGLIFTNIDAIPDDATLYVCVVGDGGCRINDSTTIERTIDNFDAINPSYDACDITEITTNLPNGIINPMVEWSFNSNFMPVDQNGITFMIPAGLSDNPTLYVRIIGDNGCVIIDSTMLNTGTDPSAGFETNDSECGRLTVAFMYLGNQNDNISWDFGDGNTSEETNPTHEYASSGTYIVTIFGADGTCAGMPFTETIVVIGPDIIPEINESQSDCFGTDVVLNPGGDSNYAYVWSPSDNLDQDDIASPIANVTETTEFTVIISDPNNPDCNITETVMLTLSPIIDVTFGDRMACDQDMIDLNPNNDQSLDYTWSPAEIFGNQVNDPNPAITVSGEIEISVIVSDPNFDNCDTLFTFMVNQVPAYDVTVDTDVVQCPGENLTINTVDNDSRALNFKWSDIDFNQISTEPILNTTITESTCFYLIICGENNECPDTTKVNAILDDVITVDVEVMDNRVFCMGDQVVLNITSDIPEGATISWSDPASGGGTSTTIIATGTMNIDVTVTSALGCEFDGSALVEVSNFQVGASAQPGCVMFPDEVVQLNSNPDAASYMWTSSPPVEISDPTIANPTATGFTENTTLTLNVIDQNGCPFEGMTQVAVQEDCNPPCLNNEMLPNLFSPNGDGINDFFTLNYAPATLVEIFIYDRWGNQVFNTTSSTIFWDGTHNDRLNQQDVYGYLIIATCPDGEEIEVGGNVTLFR